MPALLDAHKTLMATRTGDVDYAAARFAGICHCHVEGNLSLGMWNTTKDVEEAIIAGQPDPAMKAYSPGDASVVVVNVDDFTWKAYAGYLKGQAASSNEAV